jgi:hypothetical protein
LRTDFASGVFQQNLPKADLRRGGVDWLPHPMSWRLPTFSLRAPAPSCAAIALIDLPQWDPPGASGAPFIEQLDPATLNGFEPSERGFDCDSPKANVRF